jgi:hypothetical protein
MEPSSKLVCGPSSARGEAGNFDVFEELFADDFVDHTPQPNTTPDKAGVRKLYRYLRTAFPDFHAEIHWQLADGERDAATFMKQVGAIPAALCRA